MSLKNNRRGIAPLFIIGIMILILIALYLVLLIPIPAFTNIRANINYILTLIFWIVLQIGIVTGYYYAIKYAFKGFRLYQNKFRNIVTGIKRFLVMRY